MKRSKNYNMYLPDGNDFYDVEHMNYNTSVTDEELKKNMTAIDEAYVQSTGYTDNAIANLIGGAPSTLDTLKEIADAIGENQDVVEALDASIGSKASEKEFESHRTNDNIHVTANEKQMIWKIPETYLPLAGGTVSGLTTFQQGSIAHEYIHSVDAGGFLKLATFKVTEQFDFPIEFYVAELSASGNIYIRFAKDGDGYSLADFAYSGNIDTLNPHMHQSDADTWDFYIWLRGWSAISVSDLKINSHIIKGLNNGNGIIWHYGMQNVFSKYPSGAVAPTLMTYNIKLKDTDSLWMEIYNLKGRMSLKNYVKQVEVSFNNSVSSVIFTNDFLTGSALDINEITIQGLICTGIGAMLDACFSSDKSQILFYLNNSGGYTGTLKANIILLYKDGTLATPDDPISGGEIPV